LKPDPATTPILLLFDIDGTLLRSGGAGSRALNTVFRERYGVENAFEGIRPHGMTDPAILRQMIRKHLNRSPEAEEIDSLGAAYTILLEEELRDAPGFEVMPGVLDLLERLRRFETAHLGLATGNLEKASELKLRRGDLASYFDFGGFGSDSEDRAVLTQAALQRGRERAGNPTTPALVIGDTVHDVRAGRAVGAWCLGVMTTGTIRADFESEGAHLVVQDLKDWKRILDFLCLA